MFDTLVFYGAIQPAIWAIDCHCFVGCCVLYVERKRACNNAKRQATDNPVFRRHLKLQSALGMSERSVQGQQFPRRKTMQKSLSVWTAWGPRLQDQVTSVRLRKWRSQVEATLEKRRWTCDLFDGPTPCIHLRCLRRATTTQPNRSCAALFSSCNHSSDGKCLPQ